MNTTNGDSCFGRVGPEGSCSSQKATDPSLFVLLLSCVSLYDGFVGGPTPVHLSLKSDATPNVCIQLFSTCAKIPQKTRKICMHSLHILMA
jgi:hypothetical protein